MNTERNNNSYGRSILDIIRFIPLYVFRSGKYLASKTRDVLQMQAGLDTLCPSLEFDFDENWNVSTNYRETCNVKVHTNCEIS
jgi:hypothetical protein